MLVDESNQIELILLMDLCDFLQINGTYQSIRDYFASPVFGSYEPDKNKGEYWALLKNYHFIKEYLNITVQPYFIIQMFISKVLPHDSVENRREFLNNRVHYVGDFLRQMMLYLFDYRLIESTALDSIKQFDKTSIRITVDILRGYLDRKNLDQIKLLLESYYRSHFSIVNVVRRAHDKRDQG